MSGPRKIRSFAPVIRRINALDKHKSFRVSEIGSVSGLPFLMIDNLHPPSHAEYTVHLTAGIHGDEPAGVLGLISFLEKIPPKILRQVALTVFPCVNVWGYERNLRVNEKGEDINRCFQVGTNCAEVILMRKGWGKRKYDFVASCHEDYDSLGAYIYELKYDPPFWGPQILAAFSRCVTLDTRPEIEGLPALQGHICHDIKKLPPDIHAEAIYLIKGENANTRHTLTFETPSLQPLENRIAAQIAGLKKCFSLLMDNKLRS
ncbi:MAG: M14 family metallocarboxypeptidase [Verrucomicrobiota bacterium]|nr:M14 family metallocarboxypeptidase [Verrucomicrobiota bacterium]